MVWASLLVLECNFHFMFPYCGFHHISVEYPSLLTHNFRWILWLSHSHKAQWRLHLLTSSWPWWKFCLLVSEPMQVAPHQIKSWQRKVLSIMDRLGFHHHQGKLLLVNTKAFGGNGEDFEINNHTIFCPASIYVFKLLTSCSILDHFPTIFCIFKKQNDTYFLL